MSAFLQEFNKGIFDYLIATDDPAKREEHAELTEHAEARAQDPQPLKSGKKRKDMKAQQQQQRKRARKAGADEEFGVIRGIDFKGVRTVINVDAPDTAEVCVTQSLHMMAWTCAARRGAGLGLGKGDSWGLVSGVISCKGSGTVCFSITPVACRPMCTEWAGRAGPGRQAQPSRSSLSRTPSCSSAWIKILRTVALLRHTVRGSLGVMFSHRSLLRLLKQHRCLSWWENGRALHLQATHSWEASPHSQS